MERRVFSFGTATLYVTCIGVGLLAAFHAAGMSQSRTPEAPTAPAARGLYNWIHSTADAERSFQFYRDVFGIELASSPFAASSDAPPEPIRSAANAGSDALVWDLTNTSGSRFQENLRDLPMSGTAPSPDAGSLLSKA